MRSPHGPTPLRVVVAAEGAPSLSGLATFAETIVADPVLRATFDVSYVNTTRHAIRVGGRLSASNVRAALGDARRIFGAARQARVVHLHTASDPPWSLVRSLILATAARLAGAAVILHVHSFLINAGAIDDLRTGPIIRWLFRRLAVASVVLAVSEAGRELLAALIPGTRVETCDNAVDVAAFRVATPERGEPMILYVGTLLRRKGLLDFVAALGILRHRALPPWHVRIVGGGAQAGQAELDLVSGAVRDAGFGDALVGPLGGEALLDAFQGAAVFVLPSYREGQPVAIVEAMASALPVVATPVGAVPDMVRDGVEGRLVPPGEPERLADVLAELLADPAQRRLLGLAARRRAEERFDLPRLRARLSDLYRRTAAAARR